MSAQRNDRLNEAAIAMLRLLFRYGELPVPAISGLLGLYENRVEECCDELLKRELISRKAIPVQRKEVTVVQLEARGRAYLIEEGYS